MAGHIGISVIGPTQLSGTSDVLLGGASWELPAQARSILAVIPVLSSPGGPTAGEPIIAVLKLLSDDFKIQPYEVLAQPVGSSLGKSGIQISGPLTNVRYPVNCPVRPGSKLKAYGAGLIDHTIEPYMACVVVFADYLVRPQYFAKVGSRTDTGTAAAETAGAGISISGGKELVEVNGIVVGTTVAAARGILGYFRLSCAGFTPGWDLKYPAEPIPGVIATDATTSSAQEATMGVARFPVRVELDEYVTINDYFNLAVALTTTGYWVAGVIFTKRAPRV